LHEPAVAHDKRLTGQSIGCLPEKEHLRASRTDPCRGPSEVGHMWSAAAIYNRGRCESTVHKLRPKSRQHLQGDRSYHAGAGSIISRPHRAQNVRRIARGPQCDVKHRDKENGGCRKRVRGTSGAERREGSNGRFKCTP